LNVFIEVFVKRGRRRVKSYSTGEMINYS